PISDPARHDDAMAKAPGTKDFVHDDPQPVHLVVVDADEDGAVVVQEVPGQHQARVHHGEPVCVALAVRIHEALARVVGRVDVDHAHPPRQGGRQQLEGLQVVALDEQVPRIAQQRVDAAGSAPVGRPLGMAAGTATGADGPARRRKWLSLRIHEAAPRGTAGQRPRLLFSRPAQAQPSPSHGPPAGSGGLGRRVLSKEYPFPDRIPGSSCPQGPTAGRPRWAALRSPGNGGIEWDGAGTSAATVTATAAPRMTATAAPPVTSATTAGRSGPAGWASS